MLTPIRSFTLLHGFWLSNLATTVAFAPAITLLRRTKGVFPISSVTSFAIFIAISRKRSLGAFKGIRWFCRRQAAQRLETTTATTASQLAGANSADRACVSEDAGHNA